jgi:hypothetical protein
MSLALRNSRSRLTTPRVRMGKANSAIMTIPQGNAAKNYRGTAPTVSAILAPRAPRGFGGPAVVSRPV